ncbi:sensor histidine kinase [Psychrobacter sp.]|uniref:sensor histidine kinase n=1 Tax=Psychrobacter sp. TaxID=56811 RepID=UPI003F9E79FE
MTTSASTADSADIVAEQVKFLLENEPSIQSILFYSTPQPIDNLEQSAADWKNILFADTVSFNYPVTSNYIDINSDSNKLNSNSYASQTLSERINEASEANQTTTDSVLVGYINITLDVQAMREYWYRTNLLGCLIITIIAVLWVLYILRKLKWPVRDIESLTKVCEVVLENPSIDQLPVISQHFNFKDLILIKRTFVVLFNRLQKVKQDYEAIVAFEQQLHTKDVSLDVQLHNFQSMITHELKTSLNAIVGGLQLLDHDALNREQKDAVEIISSGSEKLVSSLDHIIQLNQIQKGQIHINYSEFNPLQLIADILVEFEPIAQKKGLELVSRVHHIDYSLKGDAEKIQQILSILLSNAIKFTPVGQVIITSQLTHFDKSNRWQISVKDTGIGIDSHHIDDIFNPFFQVDSSKTRQYEGSGVGLPIVKQMIQLMGATIEVDSTLGVGTQFIITIAMPTIQHSWQQSLLAGLTFIYYYYDEVGFLGAELEHLGAAVVYCQHEQLVIDEMKANKVDMVMFAEDIFPRKAESLASRIRKAEDDHRALLVYWYSPHQAQYLDSFEHGLKVAGIDYCCSAIYKDKDLSDLLQRWMVWK